MATVDSSKVYETTQIDPNFSLPPGVIDVGYRDITEPGDNGTERSATTGEVVDVSYDEATSPSEYFYPEDSNGTSVLLFPPDTVTVLSQQTRITSDGKTVVDVVLELPDAGNGLTYDIRLTKP